MGKFLIQNENLSKIEEHNYQNSTFWKMLPLLISKTFGFNITIVKVENAACKEEKIVLKKNKSSSQSYEEFEYIKDVMRIVEWNCLLKCNMLLNEVNKDI